MTGAVVARRAPAWFARYDQVPGGHVAPQERATLRGVIGVPLEWRGRIIGACIVFSRDERREFGPDDAELLQLFAKHAAIALANARMHEAAEERARTEAAAAERDRLLGELHDTLAQRLVSVQVHLDSVQRELAATAADRHDEPEGRAALAEHVGQAAAATREALVEARQTLLGLSVPPDGLDLEAALKSEAAWAETIGQLEVRLVSAGHAGRGGGPGGQGADPAGQGGTDQHRPARGREQRPDRAALRADGRVAAGPGRRPGLRHDLRAGRATSSGCA